MGGGILGFAGRSGAESAAREMGGRVLSYAELSNP